MLGACMSARSRTDIPCGTPIYCECGTGCMKGEDRLGAMVLHIVSRCGGRRNFGRVMLCRLCYFSDFGSYELRGESISGSGYILANGGPEPAGFDFLLDELTRRKMLRVSFRHGAVGRALHGQASVGADRLLGCQVQGRQDLGSRLDRGLTRRRRTPRTPGAGPHPSRM